MLEFYQRLCQVSVISLTGVGFISSIITIREYLKKQKEFKMKKIMEHPYKKPMVLSVSITSVLLLIFFLLGGGNIVIQYLNEGVEKHLSTSDINGKKVNKKDTTESQKPLIVKKEIIYVSEKTINKSKNIGFIRPVKKMIDTPKSTSKYDLSHAQLNQSAVGDNAKVEINKTPPREVTSVILSDIERRFPNKAETISIWRTSNDNESYQLAMKLFKKLKENGYTSLIFNGIDNNEPLDEITYTEELGTHAIIIPPNN